jgi:hypothetical protein
MRMSSRREFMRATMDRLADPCPHPTCQDGLVCDHLTPTGDDGLGHVERPEPGNLDEKRCACGATATHGDFCWEHSVERYEQERACLPEVGAVLTPTELAEIHDRGGA